MQHRQRAGVFKSIVLMAVASLSLASAYSAAYAQAKKPISKDGLVKAVRINGLSTSELIQQIQSRGVSFQMTPEVEAEMRQAGARPEVIEAARSNYRPSPSAPVVNTAGRVGVPKGAPLSKNEIVTMLQAGSPSSRVEQFVEARGVNFQSNAQTAREIKAAGGTNSLVGAITSNYVPAGSYRGSAATTPPQPVARRGPDYDDLTDQATAAYYAKDASRASQLLQQAVALDPSQPRAYQLLGFTQLYLQNNIAAAEANMRKAIELGGSASFRVFHDHANGSFNSTCSGTLFVTKSNITYKADDGADTFETEDTGIREIKTNNFAGGAFGVMLGGKDRGAFHIKVRRASDTKNYNFAPLTEKRAESELIIKLVQGYGGVKG
ncbi:MAG: tetratricopeptide repeat protein [Pyrinomonadaceae bacterium]